MQRIIFLMLFILSLVGFLLIQRAHSISQIKTTGCVDIPANPDYLSTNSSQDAIAAINNARQQEGLRALHLPSGFYQLNPRQQQFILVNLERTDRHLPPLRMDSNLSQMALAYDKQMLDLHFFSHTSPIGGAFVDRINGNPMLLNHYSLAAENLAGNPVPGVGPIYEYMYDDSVEDCGHRKNILDPKLTLVGISWISGGPYGSVSAQEFIASAPWNPYVAATPDSSAPEISIIATANSTARTLVCKAITEDDTSVIRITWFLDHISSQFHIGPGWTLNLSSIARGSHTIYAYAVDTEQNYGVAFYKFVASYKFEV